MITGLALKTLRHRRAAFAGAFVALVCAAALVCACLMLLETGLRGGVAPERYAGAPLIVAGDQNVHETVTKSSGKVKTKAKPLSERVWIPEATAAKLRGLPGVAKVLTEVTFPVNGHALGHGWESAGLTPFTIARGRPPRADGEVVVDGRSGLSVGAALDVRGRSYRVVGVTAQAPPSQDTVFFSTAEARRLAGRPGLVTAIGVFPRVGMPVDASSVLSTGERLAAYSGDERGTVEFLDAEQARVRLISLGGALGGTSLLVAILVVTGTSALAVQQRRREIALLRAVAATPGQVRRLLGGESLLVGLAAGVIGSAAGVGLGFWLRGRFVELGAMPANLRLVVSPFPAAAALMAAVAAAWAATRLSVRRTARIRPVEALGEAAMGGGLPLGRSIAGVLCVAAGITLTLVLSGLETEAASSPVTMLTALVWTVAVTLLGPVLARVATALLGVALRASRAGYLAARNLRSGPGRMASVMAPLTLLVAMTCTILFTQTTMGHASAAQVAAGAHADYVVSGATADAVRRVPGVKAVTSVVRTSVRIGLDKYGAQGVDGGGRPIGQAVDLGVVSGSLDGFGARSAALSESAASRLGLSTGDAVRLTLGDGTPVELKVVAIYSRGLGFGDLTLPYALVSGHVDDPSGALLVEAPSVSPAALAAAAPVVSPMGGAGGETPNAEVNYVAMGLIIAFSAIAVVNTLAMSTTDRSRELALLRLVGATRRQVLRMLRLETLTALIVSVVAGTGIALITLSAFSRGMTGSALPYIPPAGYALVIAAVAALALAATSLPARLALRPRPAEAVGARQ
ncbi:putative ABC transport system permease protein [Microbispora rosea]|uniref:Putative ABC transport system permease protein n=1 Tax=Microbispora rosea TaxID=58117 RepID=A0A1N6T0T8_9ACTN|nr:ABC transporter permease [Microbispora rosea]GIH45243.1 ABC transporter permease [Microbispora rosea subsp. rosea]SIQ46943.1 putative ABC transport system permease protein [Microbispora rosea]